MFLLRSPASQIPRVALAVVATASATRPLLESGVGSGSSSGGGGMAGLLTRSRTLFAPKRKPAGSAKKAIPAPSKVKKSTARTRKAPAARTKSAPRDSSATAAAPADSLASFHPAIASTWMAAASSKMLQPQHVNPRSRKLVWWQCPGCQAQFNRRVDLNVAAGGECPQCHVKPSAANTKTAAVSGAGASAGVHAAVADVKHRCRPDSSLSTLAADNANRIKKSVADSSYLRTTDTRNLQPMLAKNFTNEQAKIADDEVVLVSPKLDGIRCVVSYDAKKKELLFFSRAGTLFECCDAKIEPTLRLLFEKNPYLVLDGELYNDSANVAKMKASSRGKGGSTSSASDEVLDFQSLTSAIRTTRDRRTPEMEALQSKLQYHVFDVLYTSSPDGSASVSLADTPYSARYALLQSLVRKLETVAPSKTPAGFDPSVVRLVPSLPFLKSEVDDALDSAVQYGYEGVMVRRDSVTTAHTRRASRRQLTQAKQATSSDSGAFAQRLAAHAVLKQAAAATSGKASAGYGYGQRSSSLLKYKRMQDAEYIIVGAVEGKGKWKNSLGAFICMTKDGNHTFTVTPASTDEQKRRMWRNWQKELKGKALTVQFQELTTDGVPRFPIGKSVRGTANGSDWI